jgi:hypothetical protein
MFNDSNLPHEIYPLFHRGDPGEGGLLKEALDQTYAGYWK